MAFGDWDFFNLNGSSSQSLETTGAIVDSSLLITTTGGSACHGQRDSGFDRGFTKGRIRTLLKFISGSDTQQHVGVYCLSSAEDVDGSGTFYSAVVTGGTTSNLYIRKHTASGVNGFSISTILGSSQDVTYQSGSVISIQLEWNVDVPGFGGTQLKLSTGTATDYSDLTQVESVIDTSTPYTTGFAEGILCRGDSTGSHMFDNTVIFEGT